MDVAARVEALSKQFDRMIEDTATRADLADVLRETRACRKLLDQGIAEARIERQQHHIRHEAIMSLLGELVSKLG